MRMLLLLCGLYLLIVSAYMISASNALQKPLKQEYIDSYVEGLQEEIDSSYSNGNCVVTTDGSNENQCLTKKQVAGIKNKVLAAQPVYALNPEILDTTLSICNPRRGSCF